MIPGILMAIAVSVLWIALQNLWMHIRPARNRFRSMVIGYGASLPVLAGALCWLPRTEESPWLGPVQALVFHLLIFFCYVECFYHIERSVSLRLLIEILQAGPGGAAVEQLQSQYAMADMIRDRLAVLVDRRLLAHIDGVYRLRPKARLFASAVALASWIYQARGQHERE